MDKARREFYSMLMNITLGEKNPEEIAFIIEEVASKIMEENHSTKETRELGKHLTKVARSMLKGDLYPIKELAGFLLQERIALSQVAGVMFQILGELSKHKDIDEKTRITLEKMAFMFVIILSSEMNELFYQAVQRATGMSDVLFKRLVRGVISRQ